MVSNPDPFSPCLGTWSPDVLAIEQNIAGFALRDQGFEKVLFEHHHERDLLVMNRFPGSGYLASGAGPAANAASAQVDSLSYLGHEPAARVGHGASRLFMAYRAFEDHNAFGGG